MSNVDVKMDAEGYLVDPSEWTDEIAVEIAKGEGITLTDDHWRIIRFMRDWLDENGVIPDARHAMKAIGGDRDAGRARMFELFPHGYVKQACRIAGMRRPRAWSTG